MGGDTIRTDRSALMGGLASSSRNDLRTLQQPKQDIYTPLESDYRIELGYLWRLNVKYIIPVFHTVDGLTIVLNITNRSITELPGIVDGAVAIKKSLKSDKYKKKLEATSVVSLQNNNILIDGENLAVLENLIDGRRFYEVLKCMRSNTLAPVWVPLLSQPQPYPTIGTVGLVGEFIDAPVLQSSDKITVASPEETHITVSRDPFQDQSLWVGCIDLNYELLPERADLSPWLPRLSNNINVYVIGLVGISDRHYEEPMWLAVQVMRHLGKRQYKQIHASIDGEVLLMVVAKHSMTQRLGGIASWSGEISRSEVAEDNETDDITSSAAAVQLSIDETDLCFVCVKIRVLPTDFGSEAVNLKNMITTTLLSAIELGKCSFVDISCRFHSIVVFGCLGDEILKEVKKGSLLSDFHEGDLVLPRGGSLSQRVFIKNISGPYGTHPSQQVGLEFVGYEAHVPWGIIEEGRHAVKAVMKLPVQLPFIHCLSTPSAKHSFRITSCKLSTSVVEITELCDDRELELIVVSDFSISEDHMTIEPSADNGYRFCAYEDVESVGSAASFLSLRYLILSIQDTSTQETIGSATLSLSPSIDSLFDFDDKSEALGANSGVGPDVGFSIKLQKSCKYIDATLSGTINIVVDSSPLQQAMLEKSERDEYARQAFIQNSEMSSGRQSIVDEEMKMRQLWTARVAVSDNEKTDRSDMFDKEIISRQLLTSHLYICLDEAAERMELAESLQFSLASFMINQSVTTKMTNSTFETLRLLWTEESSAWQQIFISHIDFIHTSDYHHITLQETFERDLILIIRSEIVDRFLLTSEHLHSRIQFNSDSVTVFFSMLSMFANLQKEIDFDVSETLIQEETTIGVLRTYYEVELLESVEKTLRRTIQEIYNTQINGSIIDINNLLTEEDNEWIAIHTQATNSIQTVESKQRYLLDTTCICVFDELLLRFKIIETEEASMQFNHKIFTDSEAEAHTDARIRRDREDTELRHLTEQETAIREKHTADAFSFVETDLVKTWNNSVRQARLLFDSVQESNFQKIFQSETSGRLTVYNQFMDSHSTVFLTIDVQRDEAISRSDIRSEQHSYGHHLVENEEYLVRDSLQWNYNRFHEHIISLFGNMFTMANEIFILKHRSTDLEIFELLTRNQIMYEERQRTVMNTIAKEELNRYLILTSAAVVILQLEVDFSRNLIELHEDDEWLSLTDLISFPEFPDSHKSSNCDKILKAAVLQQKLPYSFAGRQRDRHQNRLVVLRSSSLSIYEEKRKIDLTLGCAAGTVPLRKTAFSISAMQDHTMSEPIVLNTCSEVEQRGWVSAILGNDCFSESGTQTVDYESSYDQMKSSALAEADRRYSRIAGNLVGKIEGQFELLHSSQAHTEASVMDLVQSPRRVPSAVASPRSASPKNNQIVSKSVSPGLTSQIQQSPSHLSDGESVWARQNDVYGRRQIRASQTQSVELPSYGTTRHTLESEEISPRGTHTIDTSKDVVSIGVKEYRDMSNELTELRRKAAVRVSNNHQPTSPLQQTNSDIVTVKLSNLSGRSENDQITSSLRNTTKPPTSVVDSQRPGDIPQSTLLTMIANHEDLPNSIRLAVSGSTTRTESDCKTLLTIISRHEELPPSIKKILKAGAANPLSKTPTATRSSQTSLKQKDMLDMNLIMKYASDWEDRSANAIKIILSKCPPQYHQVIASAYEESDISLPSSIWEQQFTGEVISSDVDMQLETLAAKVFASCPERFHNSIAIAFRECQIDIPNRLLESCIDVNTSDQNISNILVSAPTSCWSSLLTALDDFCHIKPSSSLQSEIQSELLSASTKTDDKISEILSVIPNEHWSNVLGALDEICSRPGIELEHHTKTKTISRQVQTRELVSSQLESKLEKAFQLMERSTLDTTAVTTVCQILTTCDIQCDHLISSISNSVQLPIDESSTTDLLRRTEHHSSSVCDDVEEIKLLTQAVQAARDSEAEAHQRSLSLIDKLNRLCYVNKESNVTSEIRNAIYSYECAQGSPIKTLLESPRSGRSIPRLQHTNDIQADICTVLAAAEDAACTTDRFISLLETACRSAESTSLAKQIRSAIALFTAEVQFPNSQLSQFSTPQNPDTASVSELNETIKNLTRDVDDLTTAAATCQLECEELNKKLGESDVKLRRTKKELKNLQREISNSYASANTDDHISQAHKIMLLESEVDSLRKISPTTDEETELLRTKIKVLEFDNSALRETAFTEPAAVATPLKIRALESENAELKKNISVIQSSHINKPSALEMNVEFPTNEIVELKALCDEHEQTIKNFKKMTYSDSNSSMKNTDVRKLQYTIRQSDDRNVKLMNELQTCEADLAMARDDISELENEVEILKRQHTSRPGQLQTVADSEMFDYLKEEIEYLRDEQHRHRSILYRVKSGQCNIEELQNFQLSVTPPIELVDQLVTLGQKRLEEQFERRGDILELSSAEFQVSKLFSKQRIIDTYHHHRRQHDNDMTTLSEQQHQFDDIFNSEASGRRNIESMREGFRNAVTSMFFIAYTGISVPDTSGQEDIVLQTIVENNNRESNAFQALCQKVSRLSTSIMKDEVFSVGTVVVANGLKKASYLNDKRGIVVGIQDSRYLVRFTSPHGDWALQHFNATFYSPSTFQFSSQIADDLPLSESHRRYCIMNLEEAYRCVLLIASIVTEHNRAIVDWGSMSQACSKALHEIRDVL